MSATIEREARETYQRLVAVRDEIDAGDKPWSALADFFTEDAVYIDPAWGRVEGRESIRDFFEKSMAGLTGYGWSTPENWIMVDGHRVVFQWTRSSASGPTARPTSSGPFHPLLRRQRTLLLQPRHVEHDAHRPDDEGDGVEAAGRIQHAPAKAEPRHLAAEGVGASRAEPVR